MLDLSLGMDAAVTSGQVHALLLLEMDFTQGPLRLWTGIDDLGWGGKTFNGSGPLGTISEIMSSLENRKGSLTLEMSGLHPDALARAKDEPMDDAPVNLWLGAFDHDGTIIPEPAQLVRRKVDTFNGKEEGGTATLTVTTYGRFEDISNAEAARWDHETQQAEHPGDLIFREQVDLLDTPLEISVRD